MKRIIAYVALLALALALGGCGGGSELAGLLSVRADCPEPVPAGGCGVDTIAPPTQTPPVDVTSEPYPPPEPWPTPEPYPYPAGHARPTPGERVYLAPVMGAVEQ